MNRSSKAEDRRRPTEPDAIVRFWLDEIKAAKKREDDFRKDGQRILDIYSAKKTETTPFNILFSNTETLLPALYSAVPRPVVSRRFKDEDPLGKAAAAAGQRMLEFLVDTNLEGYETFDEALRAPTLDALLPGRGWTSVKYDAAVGQIPSAAPEAVESQTGQAAPLPASAESGSYVQGELVCLQTRAWNRVLLGYAKKWSKVPWIAYEDYIDKEEATRLFGREMANHIAYTEDEERDPDETKADSTRSERDRGERKMACIYQIWDREGGNDGTKKIRYISPHYFDGYLKVDDDPLQLTGFFNCPRPLQFVEKTNDLCPTALYTIYENQAKELNRLTVRINRIVAAIKARAIYDSELGEELNNLLKGDDNTMIPADKSSSLAAEKGLQNAIWFWPVEQLVNVLNQLYVAREQCKRVIYEITGISDIVRGSTVASETATAQQIKTQWGTLRLKRLQKEVQRYARDLLRMMLELAATKFSEESWAKMTGLPFVTTPRRQQLESIAVAARAQAAQMQATGQQPTPQQLQQVQQLQAELAKPVWGQVLGMLRDDMQRAYRIDIETNSTIEPEAAEDQKQITELMTAMGQYMNGVGPLVAKGVLPFGVAQSMLLAITRRFRFGSEVEDYIKQMQAPKPEDDRKAGEAAKQQLAMQQQQMQKDAQAAQAKLSNDQKVSQLELEAQKREQEYELLQKKTELDVR